MRSHSIRSSHLFSRRLRSWHISKKLAQVTWCSSGSDALSFEWFCDHMGGVCTAFDRVQPFPFYIAQIWLADGRRVCNSNNIIVKHGAGV